MQIDIFFIFVQGELSKEPKILHFVDFDWEKCITMAWMVHILGLRCAKSNGMGFKSLR